MQAQQNRAIERRAITVHGIVQGVGFRPFIYALAYRYGLAGWVRNDVEGVHIEVEGYTQNLDSFMRAIYAEAPPLAVVEDVLWARCAPQGEQHFHIEESAEGAHHVALISPDVTVCADCLREMFDPSNRRYRYPFINCTNCGPRFTITRCVPYDRVMTTMAIFEMCPDCRREYDDPLNRRFHAQPNACPTCGPRAQLVDPSGRDIAGEHAIRQTAEILRSGGVVGIKGLGGYHLACSPFDPAAVEALRSRKVRQDKPFALMATSVEQARSLCSIGTEEEKLLGSPARPIVLMDRAPDCKVADGVAPRQDTLGVMLAYTPLHYLLLNEVDMPLVMTSGNRSDEPIAYQDDEAMSQLHGIADAFLTHNRPIHVRCDDSVVRCIGGRPSPIRRSRGYAPAPLAITGGFKRHVLACGGEMKNTFCVAKENHAFLSHHIGDLENYQTLCAYREGIEHYCRLFDIEPALVAHDLHPDYLSTQYARELEEAGLPTVGIQHHHAHIASCLADNERPAGETVIGVALDGTGYGTDGTIWGGEFFTGSIAAGFTRHASLKPIPLPGGESAIRQPWRIGLAQVIRLYGEEATRQLPLPIVQDTGDRNVRIIARLMEYGLNTPLTSSAGRLFDVVSAIAGIPGAWQTTYEGQAAIELEIAAHGASEESYPFSLAPDHGLWRIDTDNILTCVVEDVLKGRSAATIAARFHRTMAEVVVAGCERVRETAARSCSTVALSGGTFQNRLLTEQAEAMLKDRGFTVYRHWRVPTNDGGLSLGQAVLADWQFRNRGE
jgi:hydrogenase maturation protein HypF